MADRGRGRGRGRGYRAGRRVGPGRGASSSGGTANNLICYEFQRTGACERSNCAFAHVEGRSESRNNTPSRAIETKEQKEARKFYNKWRSYLTSEPSDPSVAKRFWKFGLDVLEDGDRECQQNFARDLDSEDKNYKDKGRLHIAAIMSQRARGGDAERFIKNTERFLRIVTHPSFLDCLAVDSCVGSIYNFIGGTGGSRAISFFQHVCEKLITARTDDTTSTNPPEQLESTLEAMSLALRELLKREPRARFNVELDQLLKSLGTAAEIFAPGVPTSCSTHVNHHVSCMQDMAARASGLLAPNPDGGDSIPMPSSSYPRDLIIPSNRHNNDKLDITDIVIFPTRDEILSDAPEFLPFTNPEQPHFLLDASQRHIDTHFRLYRHDIFGELKGALAKLMRASSLDKTVINSSRLQLGDIRAYQYTAAHINRFVFDRALNVQIRFLPPYEIRQQGFVAQKRWLEDSGHLARGSLLSFIWSHMEEVQHVFLKLEDFGAKNRDGDPIAFDGKLVMITARLVTQDSDTIRMLMRAQAVHAQGVLLEYPNIMPGTFVPILENLRDMQGLGGMPFQQCVVPPAHNGPAGVKVYQDIHPPLYARHGGFTFPLRSITKDPNDDLVIHPTCSSHDDKLIRSIEARTSLDRGQCQALVSALTRAFAFIQGPPGTGKSYIGLQIMKVLLAVKERADLGPILVVCYTNHALDQFLEHLIGIGVTKIVRVGAQSKSPLLANHNLQDLRKTEPRTKLEKLMARDAFNFMDGHKKFANDILDDMRHLHHKTSWRALKAHIREEYRGIYHQFDRADNEGFQVVGRHPFDIWYTAGARTLAHSSTPPRTIKDIIRQAKADVQVLSHRERLALVEHWLQEAHDVKVGELLGIVLNAVGTQEKLDNIHLESSRRILQGADVIGLTTTGLASRMSLLKHLASKVLICEEGGEILEAHMISALLPTIEHCIQIGDHEQLRPSVSNFDQLSMESARGKLHQLDRSQFERLSVGEARRPSVPVAQLNVQRRMRPEISTLIRETIYEKLVDHETTLHLLNVVGMRHNVFWLDHKHLEDGQQQEFRHSKSKSNSWEVTMVNALVRHIVRQGVYKSSDIAVLTPYTGQLQKLRNALRNDFEIVISDRDAEALEKDGFKPNNEALKSNGSAQIPLDDRVAASLEHGGKPLERKALADLLRVATIDNFQGEEAAVVILSLVRSNQKRSVGFLNISNRTNVLLSRAMHGLYLIGNTDTYSSVDMWAQVMDMLRATDCVGPSFSLRCPRHPEKVLMARNPDDFAKFSPEGGCQAPCSDRLHCGHKCGSRCHSEQLHAVFDCEAPCQRLHEGCLHPCQKTTCGTPCGKCMILIDGVQLPCQHIANHLECHRTKDLSSITCNVQVTKKVPGCNHELSVPCSRDVTKGGFRCFRPCKAPLPCGKHLCSGTCGACTKYVDGKPVVEHMNCTARCGRKMPNCSHFCQRKCHSGTDCGPCLMDCDVRCRHSKCPRRCSETCAPCIANCTWDCVHQGPCSMPCSAPCDRLPCNIRCRMLLSCLHQCPSVCGEVCANEYCQDCGMKADENPDMIEYNKPYSEINLDESPIIALPCKHFFTLETLDGVVDLEAVYEKDTATGRYIALREDAQLAVKMPQCPTCRTPIRQYATQRYNRLINKAVIDDMTKRFIVSGQAELQELERKVDQLSIDMEKSRQAILPNITIPTGHLNASALLLEGVTYSINQALKKRYDGARKQQSHIEVFQKKITKNNQPASKLHQATMSAIAKTENLENDFAKLNLQSSLPVAQSGADQRIEHGARLLQIKIQCLVLEDKLEVTRLVRARFFDVVLSSDALGGQLITQASKYLKTCTEVIEACNNGNLPKLAVETTLYHSRIAGALTSSTAKDGERKTIEKHRETAKELLGKAAKLCELPFKGAKTLTDAVEQYLKVLGKEFYAEVTQEEIEAIKKAMISGPNGIATHSGHWYNCVNGHPFAIGECGMPMEQARCPECGERIGGQNHSAVEGVTRAQDIET